MRAVNLIPVGSRRGTRGLPASPQTLGLVGALVLVLVGVLLYVTVANTVRGGRTELTQVAADAAQAQGQANALAPFVNLSKERARRSAAVRQLAASRFPWPRVLDELARLTPSDAALSSIQASTGAPGVGAAAVGPTAAAPTVQLSGCAVSHSAVAHTMDAMRLVDGVTDVALSASTEATATGGSGATSGGTGATPGGACSYSTAFQMTLTLGGAGPARAQGTSAPGGASTTAPAR